MAWRRRSLYALFPFTFIMLLETMYQTWPQIGLITDTFKCRSGDSLLACGDAGRIETFLAHDAPGLVAYHVFDVVFTVGVAAYQCVAVRVAATRGGDWDRSRHWLFLGWIVPFAFAFCKYFLPVESLFMIDYDKRSLQGVMLPVLSANPKSVRFSLCTAMHVCSNHFDLERLIMLNLWDTMGRFFPTDSANARNGSHTWHTCPDFNPDCKCCSYFFNPADPPDCIQNQQCGVKDPYLIPVSGGKSLADDLLDATMYGIPETWQYPSQQKQAELVVWLSDSGELYMDQMVDMLDHLLHIAAQMDTGKLSDATPRLLTALIEYLRAMTRAKISFTTLTTLAPLALSLIPALQAASYVVKQVFPQDPFVGVSEQRLLRLFTGSLPTVCSPPLACLVI
jgi:hypothetical protein